MSENRPFARALRPVLRHMVYASLRRLRGVYLRGELPGGPLVLAANHHSFFDGYLAYALLQAHRRSGRVMIARENLEAFPLLRLLGALGTHELRAALRALREGESLALFPEGALRPQGGLGPLERGAAYFAARAGVPLVPLALRVYVRGWEYPEAYLLLGPPVEPATAALEAGLSRALAELDDLYARTHPRETLPGFRTLLRGARGVDERMARLSRLLHP
ncbi:MAG: 1-acyl-sn-glycerol-3-phosphate acyltransferase [Meiothermus sp.]